MAIPSASDINPHGDLDGATAEQRILGKTVADAVKLCEANSVSFQEDLMWMGPVAFVYYLPAALDYLQSDAAAGDSDAVNGLCSTITFRLDDDADAVNAARPVIRQLAQYVLDHYERFEVDVAIYGDLRGSYRALVTRAGAAEA